MKKSILILLLLSFTSCSARYSPFFIGYDVWTPQDRSLADNSSLVLFDWSTLPNVITSIDGTPIVGRFKKANLPPGKHRIEYAAYPAQFGAHPKGVVEIDLIPGHEYEFRMDFCFWCKPRRYAVWVDDKTTGELAWGKHRDWPVWWL
jgi:hypothetical protein